MKYFLCSFLLLIPAGASRAALIDDVVHVWEFDETSGTRVDTLGGYNLTDNNTVGYTAGMDGNAALFEADNTEYLSYTPNWLDYAGTDWSFSIWVRSDGNASQYRGIVGNRFGTYGTWLTLGSSVTTGYLTLEDCGSHSVSMHDGQWHHIVVTHDDAATDVTRVYKDGTQVFTCNYGAWGGTGNDLRLGLWYEGSQYWDGAMDAFYWFDAVLDSTAVLELYADSEGLFYDFSAPVEPGAGPVQLSSTTPASMFLAFNTAVLAVLIVVFLTLTVVFILLDSLKNILE